MESLNRLVTESLARHGFDRPLDYRRLHWSNWFRCDSPHSLLLVPSKPGVFAIAEEVAPFCGASGSRRRHPERSEGSPSDDSSVGARRMLAVLQFCEEEDMAFVLDRMFSRQNPMRARLASGRCFVRFVVLEDEGQRRSICAALNQWLISSGERATGIGAHFASSLELPRLEPVLADDCVPTPVSAKGDHVAAGDPPVRAVTAPPVPNAALDSGSVANTHCPQPLPSGF
jgi:hypothetical protein